MSLNTRMIVWLGLAAGALACSASCESAPRQSSDWQASPPEYYASVSDVDSDFARGAARAPTARTLHVLAGILAAKGQDAEAHAVLTSLIKTYPKFTPAYSALAELHLRHDRPQEAQQALAAGLKVDPRDPALINNLGMCRLLARDYDGARQQFERAAQIAPGIARYRANLALAAGLTGDYERSLDVYKDLVKPEEAQHNLELITAARARQGLRDADTTAVQATARDGWEPEFDDFIAEPHRDD